MGLQKAFNFCEITRQLRLTRVVSILLPLIVRVSRVDLVSYRMVFVRLSQMAIIVLI